MNESLVRHNSKFNFSPFFFLQFRAPTIQLIFATFFKKCKLVTIFLISIIKTRSRSSSIMSICKALTANGFPSPQQFNQRIFMVFWKGYLAKSFFMIQSTLYHYLCPFDLPLSSFFPLSIDTLWSSPFVSQACLLHFFIPTPILPEDGKPDEFTMFVSLGATYGLSFSLVPSS